MDRKKPSKSPIKTHAFLDGIRVISFDVGFTLIYPDPRVGEVYVNIARRFGYHIDAKVVDVRFMNSWKKAAALNRQNLSDNAQADEARSLQWWKEIFIETMGDMLAAGDLDRIFKEVYDEFARGKYWQIYPEVTHTLTTLKSMGFRLVVLSNWDKRLLQTLEELELDRFFEKIYISSLIGFAKPDPGAFHHIIDDLNIPGPAILHIGDTLEEDIEGARQANVRALHINRRGKNKTVPGHIPTISSLAELIE